MWGLSSPTGRPRGGFNLMDEDLTKCVSCLMQEYLDKPRPRAGPYRNLGWCKEGVSTPSCQKNTAVIGPRTGMLIHLNSTHLRFTPTAPDGAPS
jgi:hypothetical protein